jgi:uncharacterized membrane protein YeaQ/YmgE (transglycosylase-associated protein family)
VDWISSAIGWVIFGAIAGLLARMLKPGDDSMGLGSTILLGIAGSLVGGAISYVLHLGTSPYAPARYILSIIGAIILLSFGFFARRTRVTGP